MLRRIAFAQLPRDPESVQLLHHTSGGVVIAAVAYKRPSPDHHHHRHLTYFTVVEMPAPNAQGLPLRVVHVRVPQPATAVTSLTMLRSADGEDVYVLVQAVDAAAQGDGEKDGAITTYVYRRQVVATAAAAAGGDEYDDNEEDDEGERADDQHRRRHSPAAAGSTRVRYQRLPRPVAGADGAAWTAAAAFSTVDAAASFSSSSAAGGAASESSTYSAALLTASRTVGHALGENALQLWRLSGTRVTLAATWRIPALDGFAVAQILTLPGTQDVAILRHHNALLEVNLAAMRGACAHYPNTVTTNAFLTRAWRWAAHDRLTASAVKDAVLFAGSEQGMVMIWDVRQPTKDGVTAPSCCAAALAPITGLHAPYATGFVSCDAASGARDWRDSRDENGADDDSTSQYQAKADEEEQEERRRQVGAGALALRGDHGVLGDTAAARTAASASFPYRAVKRADAEDGGSGGAAVAMGGDGNFVALVDESGCLRLYFCS